MKKKAFFLPLLAALAMVGCSSDETVDNGGNTPGKFTGDVAYMTVNIQDVNAVTRATTDGGYEFGNPDEHAVNDARFFFFDKNGTFVTEASVWTKGDDGPNKPNGNIEYIGKNVLVLDNLTETGLPSYLLTVLNAPTFEVKATLKETAESLTQWASTVEGKFVMSTSSYLGGSTAHDKYYYATEVQSTDFKKQPVPTTGPELGVTVYVERLAAKVELGLGEAFKATAEDGMYKITATIAGNPNDEENPDDKGTTDLYVKFNGWALNATARQTFLSKQLESTWLAAEPFTGWNKTSDFRSYWAKSYVYGKTPNADVLTYVTQSELAEKGMEGPKYCNENTNKASIISQGEEGKKTLISSAVTSVLVKATLCDAKGNGLDLVRYNGLLYKKADFLQYVLNTIDLGAGKLNLWVKTDVVVDEGNETTTTTTTYNQIDSSSVKLAYEGTNASNVVVKSNLKEMDAENVAITYYYKEGNDYKAYDSYEAAKTALDNLLANVTIVGEAFTGGAMYYNIPIEHQAATAGTTFNGTQEGYYGVVRNHWYKLTINSLTNLGHGLFVPGEGEEIEEVPIEPEDPKDAYYLGAQINILSWKVLSQGVDL